MFSCPLVEPFSYALTVEMEVTFVTFVATALPVTEALILVFFYFPLYLQMSSYIFFRNSFEVRQ